MNSYQQAVKALENCVKDAMENDVDNSLQMEIWRHYQGMKAIAMQLKEPSVNSEFQFNLNTDDYIPYDIGDSSSPINFGAAQAGEMGDVTNGALGGDAVQGSLDDGVGLGVRGADAVPIDHQVPGIIAVRQPGRGTVETGRQDALIAHQHRPDGCSPSWLGGGRAQESDRGCWPLCTHRESCCGPHAGSAGPQSEGAALRY